MWIAVRWLRDAVRPVLARALALRVAAATASLLTQGIGFVASTALAASAVGTAHAAPPPRRLSIPGSGAQKSLAVELAADGLWLAVCSQPSCSARTGRAIELPPEARAEFAAATLESLELTSDRRVGHARIALPTLGTAWEALFAAPVGGSEPLVIFAGSTGAVRGEDGAREGDMLWIREGDSKGRRVLLGRVREDVELCGRPTILEPRLLDRDLALHPAKVQQLSLEERRGATLLEAKRRDSGPTRGGNAVRALAASSAIGNPAFLTDGRTDTSWSEGRGGDGRGEFATFRPLSGAALVALEFAIRPEGDAAPADGAAPRSFWLATRSSVFRVDFAEDAWRAQGTWYRVDLPAPLTEDCLAIVLESSYSAGAESSVTLAEVRGVSELQGLDPVELVARLSTPGAAGADAVPALLQSGRAGVDAVVGAFGALDTTGRLRALDVLETGPCDVVAQAYVELLSEQDPRLKQRALQRLRSCGAGVSDVLREAFERASGEAGVRLARSLAELTPALAVELLGTRLVAAAREQRPHYRAALQRAAQHPEAEAAVRQLLGERSRGVSVDIEVLRALGELLPRFEPDASQSFARAAAGARSFDQRYLLLEPAAALAPRAGEARAFVARALRDPDPYLRTAAARALPPSVELEGGLVAATRDPEVRVREASVLRLGELRPAAAGPPLQERLGSDAWPLVRASAARALGGLGPSPELDAALAARLEDAADVVRAAALRSLGQRGAQAFLPVVRERFADRKESATVREAAARALAQLCDRSSLEALTQSAHQLLGERPSPDDALLATASVAALGRLHPADLAQRLEPLARVNGQPALGALVTAALQAPDRCPLSSAVGVAPSR
jgi:HEAT repeats